jgi:hypothetical protein
MNISDLIFEISAPVFGLKILNFFDADPDPGSEILSTLDPGSGINSPDPKHCKKLYHRCHRETIEENPGTDHLIFFQKCVTLRQLLGIGKTPIFLTSVLRV